MELRNLLKTNFELFDFEYQFDDPVFKKKLEQAVIDFYYNYEIGQETPDAFKQRFKSRWLRNIDYYNKLYNTTLLEYNPLINSKMSEAMEQLSNSNSTQDSESESISNGTSKTSDTSKTDSNTDNENTTTNDLTSTSVNSSSTDSNEKTSDYPQQSIRGGDYASGERVADTLTSSEGSSTNTGTVKNVGSSTGTSSITGNGTAESSDKGTSKSNTKNTNNSNTSYAKTIEGLTGITYQDLIIKERNNLLRIENMVIEEMKPCFLLVY